MTATRIAPPRLGGPRVAYQGEPGAYGEVAITREWRGQATAVGTPTFADALALLGRGGTDFAAIPVWNSTIGNIQDTALLLAHHASRVDVVSELTVPIQHCLLGLPGATVASVRYVGSHPTALAQCKRLFADRRHLQPCVARDTAGAARELASLGGIAGSPPTRPASPPWFEPYRPADPRAFATIAGGNVAAIYGLVVLAESVQDDPANATRFVIVGPRDGAQW
jgi:prephenate dehydratase